MLIVEGLGVEDQENMEMIKEKKRWRENLKTRKSYDLAWAAAEIQDLN